MGERSVILVDLDEMLRRATADLERSEAEARLIQQRLDEARARVNELRVMRDGARMLVERYGETDAATPVPTSQEVGSGGKPRLDGGHAPVLEDINQAELAMMMLRETGRATHTDEVYERQKAAGYPYDHEQIRSALGYLLRKGRIQRVGSATWIAPGVRSDSETTSPV